MASDKYAALRAEFVAQGTPLATIAEREGIPYRTLQDAAYRQKWREAREEYVQKQARDVQKAENEATIAAAENAAQERVQAREDANKRHRELALTLQGEIARAIKAARTAQEPQSAGAIRQLAGALESVQRVERLALGMNTESQAVQVEPLDMEALEAALARRADA